MSLLFTGFYGQLNTGDDAFCVVSEWGARRYWQIENSTFHGRNLPINYDNITLKSSISAKKHFRGQEILENLHLLRKKYDPIIYSGGSVLFKEISFLSKENVLIAKNRLRKNTFGAIGVSLGPFKTSEAHKSIRNYLGNFSFLALRDSRSFNLAQEMNLNIPIIEAFDLAALLPEIYPNKKYSNQRPIVGVSVCNYESLVNGDFINEKRRINKIIDSLKSLFKQIPDMIVKFLIINDHPVYGDKKVSQFVASKLPEALEVRYSEYSPNPRLMWDSISNCSVVLATRLHAGIFSCFSETPFIQIEYHKKCSDLLNDLGYEKNYMIGDFEVSVENVVHKIISLINSKDRLVSNIEECKSKAEHNFSLTKDYIN